MEKLLIEKYVKIATDSINNGPDFGSIQILGKILEDLKSILSATENSTIEIVNKLDKLKSINDKCLENRIITHRQSIGLL